DGVQEDEDGVVVDGCGAVGWRFFLVADEQGAFLLGVLLGGRQCRRRVGRWWFSFSPGRGHGGGLVEVEVVMGDRQRWCGEVGGGRRDDDGYGLRMKMKGRSHVYGGKSVG
ncbi:hypothetical protein Dimus_007727, partial [Dionaea muscipula]